MQAVCYGRGRRDPWNGALGYGRRAAQPAHEADRPGGPGLRGRMMACS
jgi:hypothetical protein